jgi:hypothetical protein
VGKGKDKKSKMRRKKIKAELESLKSSITSFAFGG